MKRILSIIACAWMAFSALQAVPAKRLRITHVQKDGTTLIVTKQGDEHLHYYTTDDGIILSKGTDGHFYYSVLSAQETLAASAQLAHLSADRTAEEAEFARKNRQTIANHIPQIRQNKQQAKAAPMKVSEVHPNGSPRIPVILIQYKDVAFSEGERAHAGYQQRVGQEGYTEGRDYGSVRDYFIAQSGGLFNPQFDIIGPVTLENNREYYGANDWKGDDIRPAEMVLEACTLAKAEGLIPDFSVYDNDGDGIVDVLYTIYAGVGEASSEEENSIWPHQWDFRSAMDELPELDGVLLYSYACNNELYGNEIDGIGTFCHEFSHCLGLPDFYPTNNRSYFGMDTWDVMDYGSYNDNSHTPCGYTAYEKEFMGWKSTEALTQPCAVRLAAAHTPEGQAFKIINESNPDEYFLLENRQQEGWDSALLGHGMLVMHVDYDEQKWFNNAVNNSSQQGMTILPADGELGNISLSSRQGDPYPGIRNVTEIPSFEVYDGEDIAMPVTNITESDGVVSFDFMGGDPTSVTTHEAVSVKALPQSIAIHAETGGQARIYTANGILYKTENLTQGEHIIRLPQGLYIVQMGNASCKVVVR